MVRLPEPHEGQKEVLNSAARFKVVCCGRRWGKTTMAMIAAVERAQGGGFVWWVLPNYGMASNIWRDLRTMVEPETVDKNETQRRIELSSGGVIQVRSADKPDTLRGEGLDLVVIDEAAMIATDEAWLAALRPALSDRKGDALLISTPSGMNWFWREWSKGQDQEANPEYESWRMPTGSSPYIDAAEIDAAEAMMPAAFFDQEYLAQFTGDAGRVFRNVRACLDQTITTKPQPERWYVMGVDWGQMDDFTVLTVIERRKIPRAVAIDRFNRLPWRQQQSRVMQMADRWKVGVTMVEQNSIGGPNLEALQHAGLNVRGFTTTAASKADIIQTLALAFEQEAIRIPHNTALLSELDAFEAQRMAAGWKYEAPSGLHDDMVMSLAIALEAVRAGTFSLGTI